MSTDPHNAGHAAGGLPHNADVSFEKRDVQASTIYWYLIALALAVAASFAVCVYILRFTNAFVAQSDTPPPPSRAELKSDPNESARRAEPYLQGIPITGHQSDPQTDLREKIKADTEANEQFAWVDKGNGVAQIPVKDAMKIIAEKGLPAVAAPPAEKKK
jgi:hypothetical protein